MTNYLRRQQKNDFTSTIVSKCKELKDLTHWKNYEIAAALGVQPETISRGATGKTNSEQLLRGIELLIELQKRKQIHWPGHEARQRIALLAQHAQLSPEEFCVEFASLLGEKYLGEFITRRASGQFAMNESAPEVSSAGRHAAEAEALRVMDEVEARSARQRKRGRNSPP